jgi:glucokinase
MSYIGIDIGGSSIKSVLYRPPSLGRPQLRFQNHQYAAGNLRSFISEIKTHIDGFIREVPPESIKAIGLGTPGPMDLERTKILPGIKRKLEFLTGVNLASEIKKNYSQPVFWENDANLFALAEAVCGAAQGADKVLGITLGTGLGGGIVCREPTASGQRPATRYKIYKGKFGSAGEIGHMVIKDQGFECYCGRRGCLEQYVSQSYLDNKVLGTSINQLHRLIELGDKRAESLMRKMGYYLGVGLVNLINILDPETVVIGGGLLASHANLVLDEAVLQVREKAFSVISAKNVKVVRAKLGIYAGAIGAVIFAHENFETEIPAKAFSQLKTLKITPKLVDAIAPKRAY